MQRTALVAAVLTGCLWAAPAVRAADWTALGGEEIAQALAGRRLVYEDGARQTFRESGGTSYQAGTGLSEGRWRVGADRYCSVWPPSDTWVCYTLERDAETGRLRFLGAGGGVTVGVYDQR